MGATPKAAVFDDEILEVLSSSDEPVDDRRGWGEAWRKKQSSLDTWKVRWGKPTPYMPRASSPRGTTPPVAPPHARWPAPAQELYQVMSQSVRASSRQMQEVTLDTVALGWWVAPAIRAAGSAWRLRPPAPAPTAPCARPARALPRPAPQAGRGAQPRGAGGRLPRPGAGQQVAGWLAAARPQLAAAARRCAAGSASVAGCCRSCLPDARTPRRPDAPHRLPTTPHHPHPPQAAAGGVDALRALGHRL
jgi:hypothetical protein